VEPQRESGRADLTPIEVFVMRNPPWRVVSLTLLLSIGSMLVLAPSAGAARPRGSAAPLPGSAIPKYVDELPQLPMLDGTVTSTSSPAVLTLEEFQQQILPASVYRGLTGRLRRGTYVWSYTVQGRENTYPGPTIEARTGTPTVVRFVNDLQAHGGQSLFLQGRLPVDQTIHWADPLHQSGSMAAYSGPVPAVAHLHGAEVPSYADGGPDAWWTPGFGLKGPGFVSDTYTYPNTQEPTTLWYHDHTLGATRLNVYAGLCAAYVLRDPAREPADLPGGPADLPQDRYGHSFEQVLIVQDKTFDDMGQLTFPSEGVNPGIHPYWAPEYFGDVIVVNGKSWPYLRVEPRRYRFRLVNASNARFYELHLTDPTPGHADVPMWQIGTDGGLLDAPVAVSAAGASPPLLVAPGERADLIVDFSGHEGETLTLRNAANGPYPDGDPVDPETNGQVMRFIVGMPLVHTRMLDNSLDPSRTRTLRSTPIERPEPPATDARALTLNEQMGPDGPVAGYINNTMWRHPTGESCPLGATEVWEIINLTGDAHPFHLHLVQFQVLSRQDFDVDSYMAVYGMPMEGMGPPRPYDEMSAFTGFKLGGNPDVTPFLIGSPRNVDANENGWKDTFRMNPGVVTRVLIRMAPQNASAMTGGRVAAGTNLFQFDPSSAMGVRDDGFGYPGGPGYVWHCHILDHEDNEMMHRLLFTQPTSTPGMVAAAAAVSSPGPPPVEPAGVHPNPSLGSVRIAFSLERAEEVELTVYDVAGREVATLADGRFAPGDHAVTWDGRDRSGQKVASGAYLYRLRTGERAQVQKLMLVQ
jgi:FtsP/CotA-like multicopper oxidase with cupredoxin domain